MKIVIVNYNFHKSVYHKTPAPTTLDSLSCSLHAPRPKKPLKTKNALQQSPVRRLLLHQTLEFRLSVKVGPSRNRS